MVKIKDYRALFASLILFCAAIGFDRYTKSLAIKSLQLEPYHVFPYFDFVYVENYGAVFGLFADKPINFAFISIVSIFVILALIYYLFKRIPWVPVSLIIGGAIGNILDRYLYGYVVDFIKVGSFYVFNIADVCVTVGAGLLLLSVLKDSRNETNENT
ncbi:MAG: signal peptidase II [Caldisericia bacterium]|nr:signal peptidase II [Caldisericia bacterium]